MTHLDALFAQLPRDPDATTLASVLVQVGNALHDRIAIPASLDTWLRERSLRELAEALACMSDDRVALATGALRVAIVLRVAPGDIDGLAALLDETASARIDAIDPAPAPHDAALAEYVEHGTLSTWIEGAAARSSELREELLAIIETARVMGEGVSLVARRWVRAQGDADDTLVFPIAGILAAADFDTEAPAPEFVWLGRLAPLPCTARLVIEAGSLELRVDDPDHALESISLDGTSGAPDEPRTLWTARIAVPRASFAIEVRARDGRVFADRLRLALEEL